MGGSQNKTLLDKIDDDIESDYDFSDYATDNNSSIITFFHKITSNNITKMPSSSVLPLIKTTLRSVSGENALLFTLGGLLPVLMMALPLAIMFVVILRFLLIGWVITMFGGIEGFNYWINYWWVIMFGIGADGISDW